MACTARECMDVGEIVQRGDITTRVRAAGQKGPGARVLVNRLRSCPTRLEPATSRHTPVVGLSLRIQPYGSLDSLGTQKYNTICGGKLSVF